jgi:hypothetical protein
MKKKKNYSKKRINSDAISNSSVLEDKELSSILGGGVFIWDSENLRFIYRASI